MPNLINGGNTSQLLFGAAGNGSTSLAVSSFSRIQRRGFTMLAGAVLPAVAVLTLTPPARADFSFFDPVRNQKDETFCIGIGGGSSASGAEAGLFRCDGRPNQAYRLFGSIFDSTIMANHSNKCLRISQNSTAVGAPVVQGSCTSPSSHWELTNLREGRNSRLASIRNRHTGMCIGVPGGNIFHDAKIQMFNCDLNAFGNQNWVVNQNRRPMP